MQPIRVGFFSVNNYFDKNSFSGALYYMHKALSKQKIKLVNLGLPRRYFQWRKLLSYAEKVGFFRLKNSHLGEQYEKFIAVVKRQLKSTSCDLIFAPVASKELSFLETDIPIVFLSDATPKLLHETYKFFLTEEDFLSASNMELAVLSKANRIVYSSEWAANSAVLEYGAAPNKINVVPFGANLDTVPDVSETRQKYRHQRCRLLFIGKNWQRKGADIAFQTLVSLLNMGIDAELIMVGTVPPAEIQHERLTIIPFLNKNVPQQQEKYNNLLLESHFLISPTRADCSPLVFAEANAYGIPVITSDVGGISTIVKNGQNGYMLPVSASSHEYADLIATNFANKDVYEQLVRLSRQEYDTRLNWDTWAENLHQIMLNTLEGVEPELSMPETQPMTLAR
ncbi:glycosyltransferase family 4 protein [Coleofasciculus sp. F4-SAH-05]|uniref:glycosyltransferase family 4 protein n=1 Tax=Coleofasciculus sp. F4-SAH-05 TaxID=3069525 RepID=UPI0032F8B600